MESKDPISKRYVYEPGLEDGMTNDYLAELEKLGYRTEDVNVKMPECKTPEIQTEFEPEEKEEVEVPEGWVLLHPTVREHEVRSKIVIRENYIYEVTESTLGDGRVFLLIGTPKREPEWLEVDETFDEVVRKIGNAL